MACSIAYTLISLNISAVHAMMELHECFSTAGIGNGSSGGTGAIVGAVIGVVLILIIVTVVGILALFVR